MTVSMCQLTDMRSSGDNPKFLYVWPVADFVDSDGVGWSGRLKFDYTANALGADAKVPRKDHNGNVVLWNLRRIMGSGTRLWENVALDYATVALDDITPVPGSPIQLVPVVTRVIVNGAEVDPDSEGVIDLGTISGNDSNAVHLTGNETVGGVKTFTAIPGLPGNPTNGLQAAPKQYVDLKATKPATGNDRHVMLWDDNLQQLADAEAALATRYGASALSPATGIKGDGVTDDTAALKALIANNTYIFLPWTQGGYRITGPLYDTPISTRKVIVGQAYCGPLASPVDYGTRIWVANTTTWDPTKYVLYFTGQSDPAVTSLLLPGVTMKDIRIAGTEGDASLQTSMNGLMFDRCRDVALTNVFFNKVQGCCLDFRSTWDSVFVNIKAMKSGDGSTRTITDVATTSASNVVTSASITVADEGADVTGTGIPTGAKLLRVSGTTGYLSANATATGSGVSVSVVRNVQVVRCLPYAATVDPTQADTNTLTWFSLHIEEHFAGAVLLGRQTRRCKFFGGKFHGQANKATMTRRPHFRLESAYANIFAGVQFSKAGRHQLEFDSYVDPVTLAVDAQWSDANMFTASYFDSAGTGTSPTVTDGTSVRIFKGNRNTFGQCEFEDNDLNVVVDSGNTGNVVAFSPLGLSGVQADLTNKFTGPLTYIYVDPTTQALSVRDINGHLIPLVDVTSGVAAGGTIPLSLTAVKTAGYTAAANQAVPVDTTSGAVTVTLPTAPADRTRVLVKHIIQGGSNAVTVNCAGSDVFNKTGGATTMTLPLLAQAVTVQYDSASHVWLIQNDDLPLAQLDARFAATTDARLSDTRTPTAGSVVDASVSASAAIAESKLALASDAAAGTASRRTLGTGATQAAAGNDSRLSDTRTPTDGTVTDAKVAAGAAIAESKLSLASDAAAGTASRRTLGTGATQAMAGNDSRVTSLGTAANQPTTAFDAAGAATAARAAADAALQAVLYLTPARLDSFPRLFLTASAAPTSGTIYFVFCDAPWDATAAVTNLCLSTGGTAPSALTLCRAGRYTRDGSNNLALESFTADFKASMAVATDFTVPLAAGSTVNGVTCPTNITWTRGAKYAFAYLFTGTAHPVLRGAPASLAAVMARTPVMTMTLASQTDLPATATFASLTQNTLMPWMAAS